MAGTPQSHAGRPGGAAENDCRRSAPILTFVADGGPLLSTLRRQAKIDVVRTGLGTLLTRVNGIGEGGFFSACIDRDFGLAIGELAPPMGTTVSLYFIRTAPLNR